MELSRYLREYARTVPGKQQRVIENYARALEVIKEKKFVTITHAHSCNTKFFVMRKNASQPNFIRDFPSVSAIQGKFVMLRKFVMQNLQVSDCDKLFSLHRC